MHTGWSAHFDTSENHPAERRALRKFLDTLDRLRSLAGDVCVITHIYVFSGQVGWLSDITVCVSLFLPILNIFLPCFPPFLQVTSASSPTLPYNLWSFRTGRVPPIPDSNYQCQWYARTQRYRHKDKAPSATLTSLELLYPVRQNISPFSHPVSLSKATALKNGTSADGASPPPQHTNRRIAMTPVMSVVDCYCNHPLKYKYTM